MISLSWRISFPLLSTRVRIKISRCWLRTEVFLVRKSYIEYRTKWRIRVRYLGVLPAAKLVCRRAHEVANHQWLISKLIRNCQKWSRSTQTDSIRVTKRLIKYKEETKSMNKAISILRSTSNSRSSKGQLRKYRCLEHRRQYKEIKIQFWGHRSKAKAISHLI
jgi:hypothetical protein